MKNKGISDSAERCSAMNFSLSSVGVEENIIISIISKKINKKHLLKSDVESNIFGPNIQCFQDLCAIAYSK